MRRLSSTLCVLALLASPASFADEPLYQLIKERLSWMEAVAAYKFQRNLSIENLDREAIVIQSAVKSGLKQGITTESSHAFFGAQIEAAKAIQSCWYEQWGSGSFEPTVFDLDEDVRPELIRLGDAITERLAIAAHNEEDFRQIVQLECLPESATDRIFDTLQAIALYPDRLTQIRESGTLRVGTTGDYAPFSYSSDGKNFSGIDIDMAHALADSLGVTVVFFKTSWPGLMSDLEAGYYDVGMSGISKIPAREQVAFFTTPYHIGGKTPIARCEDASRFSSLNAIDQPGVTLIVNPGGTNQRFLQRNINNASVRLHNDNRTIFDEIIRGKADLMITDSIEVRLQSALQPALCATMPGETLTYQEKAYMMPSEASLRSVLNEWLNEVRASGKLTRTFEKHLGE